MGLVSEWRRKTLGAVSASLLLPIVLLLAAVAVASGGNLGGLGSLGQVASGPSLPETGAPSQEETSLADAGVVGADVPAAEARAAASAATTAGGDVALAQATPSTPAPTTSAAPPASTPDLPTTPLPNVTPAPPAAAPSPAPPVDTTPTGGGSSPNLVGQVLDTTQGLVEGLPIVGPLTSPLLELLLGPR